MPICRELFAGFRRRSSQVVSDSQAHTSTQVAFCVRHLKKILFSNCTHANEKHDESVRWSKSSSGGLVRLACRPVKLERFSDHAWAYLVTCWDIIGLGLLNIQCANVRPTLSGNVLLRAIGCHVHNLKLTGAWIYRRTSNRCSWYIELEYDPQHVKKTISCQMSCKRGHGMNIWAG